MIEAVIRAALKQRIVVIVIALGLVGAGIDGLRRIAVDAFPDVTNIQVQIAAEAPGRSPVEVERFVTVPLEIAMTGLPGLTEMRSVNRSALSQITLVFTDETDVYFARQLVMERLLEVSDRLPPGVKPVLGPVSTGLGEVYQYTLERPDDGKSALSERELTERRTVQDWVVRPLLRGIPGVAEINSIGGLEKQYQVLVDPDRLRHYGVTLKDVYTALANNNANAGGGVLRRDAEQYLVRGIGLIASLDDIASIVLKEKDGTPVFVRDVAQVSFGHAVRFGAVIKNGYTESVGGIVLMFRGGNAKEIVGRVKQRVKEINDKGMLPDGLKIVPYYDRTDLVNAAIWTVTKVLIEGIVLVVIVLFLFLGDLRSSLIVVATLIVTPLVTFLVMNEYHLSANLMSLGGLAIAIGMMVDGSVVVVENTFRHLGESKESGESRNFVVLRAAVEVGTPVLFGVGIICLVFLPLMTLQGMEGKMFAPLAYVIAIAMFVSLVLSLTLSPVLCSYFLRGGAEHDTRLVRLVKKPYLRVLDRALDNPRQVVFGGLVLLVASVAASPLLGTSFIPEMKEGSIVPGINRVTNMSIEESIALESEAMLLVKEVPGVAMVVSQLGRSENPTDTQPENESTPIATITPAAELPPGWDQNDVAAAIREKLQVLPGVQIVMAQPISDRVDELVTGVRSDIAIKIFGDDIEVLKEKADEVVQLLGTIRGASDIRLERVSGQQYLTIAIDRRAIARHGINVADINDIIETAIRGRVATEVYEGERRFSAAVRFPAEFRNNADKIGQILVRSPNGALIPLKDLARIEVVEGPAQVSRETAKRRIVVGANVQGRDLGGFVAELQDAAARQIKLPEGYYFSWGGQFENLERATKRLMIIIPITIAAIFFLLFLLFNSVRYAAIIILVLPFASIGGIFALLGSGEYLSVPASVGFITLWGIAVLNGVVLVSYIRSLREEGMAQRAAIVQGCTQRLRPVLMTATVAMLGLIPFLFATGPGSEVQRPLAVVVIGGLITSTLLTLVVLPALYGWFEEKKIEA
ncbi:MAG: CusA/CzcA family heavy metal efflux RND transporter [Burkholderiales bacterium]|nr:CusA/CzcA family heavy metal efflux RND transporter [Burkholderiales bacterium]